MDLDEIERMCQQRLAQLRCEHELAKLDFEENLTRLDRYRANEMKRIRIIQTIRELFAELNEIEQEDACYRNANAVNIAAANILGNTENPREDKRRHEAVSEPMHVEPADPVEDQRREKFSELSDPEPIDQRFEHTIPDPIDRRVSFYLEHDDVVAGDNRNRLEPQHQAPILQRVAMDMSTDVHSSDATEDTVTVAENNLTIRDERSEDHRHESVSLQSDSGPIDRIEGFRLADVDDQVGDELLVEPLPATNLELHSEQSSSGSHSQGVDIETVQSNSVRLSSEKPFTCDICKRSFRRKNSLSDHMRIHAGEKPFTCDICKRSFRHKNSLSDHMRIHAGEKPFTCDICKLSFRQKGHLLIHMRIHADEKPFTCDICKLSFRQKGHLLIHMRIHAGENPFTCDICKRSFRHKSNLLTHMRIHTGGTLFSCQACNKSFMWKSHLRRHLKAKH